MRDAPTHTLAHLLPGSFRLPSGPEVMSWAPVMQGCWPSLGMSPCTRQQLCRMSLPRSASLYYPPPITPPHSEGSRGNRCLIPVDQLLTPNLCVLTVPVILLEMSRLQGLASMHLCISAGCRICILRDCVPGTQHRAGTNQHVPNKRRKHVLVFKTYRTLQWVAIQP